MKTVVRVGIAVLVFVWGAAGCDRDTGTDNSAGAVFTKAHDGSKVWMTVGGHMTVRLPGNPTTGYSWQQGAGNSEVIRKKDEVVFDPAPACGNLAACGGTFTFRFEAVGSGQTDLQLVYRRPWENTPPFETYTLKIVVE